MNRSGDLVGTIIGYSVGLAILALNFIGIYHAFNKHNIGDGVLSIAVPPWAWYRGAEAFWHDDYDGVNWQTRLQSDVMTATSLYYTTDADKFDPEKIERFSSRISDYPDEKKQYLEECCLSLCKVVLQSQREIITAFQSAKSNVGSERHDFRYSDSTLHLMEVLDKKYGVPEIKASILNETPKDLAGYIVALQLDGTFEKFIEDAAHREQTLVMFFKRTHKMIFGHEPTQL